MPLTAIAYATEPIGFAEAADQNSTEVSTASAIARLDHVTRRYGSTLALNGFDLSLHAGEIVALLGPNGAGKSTAIKILLGLVSPTSGTARVFAGDPRQTSTRVRIGAMLQVARIPEVLRVREHIDLFRSYYPAPMAYAEVVRSARLEGIEERKFGQLSGGQKQRVLFALAICGNPDLIFLDEPSVGLDIEARRALWQEIRLLSAMGKTILLTTHYLEEADALADRIVVMNKGRVIRQGTPADIKRSSGGRTIRCRTSLPPEFLSALPTVTNVECAGETVVLTVFAAELVVRQLLAHDETLSNLEIAAPALEDAFLALTRE